MRPDPRQLPPDDSGRIIYLGDVRRRRSARRQAPDAHYLGVALLAAIAGWGTWLLVIFNLAPSKLLSYLAFFTPLVIAVTATGVLLSYGVEWRRGYLPSLSTCLRRGLLLAGAVVLNLGLRAARDWNPLILAVVVLGAAAAEMVLEYRSQHG